MADRNPTGELFGIPYNFERPKLSELFSSYWQPEEGMLVEKPFGIGYTLNLASWRSWLVLALAGALVWHERQRGRRDADAADEPVEVVVDD